MKFFLNLKHWQLFIITWGLPLIVNIYSFSKPMILFQLFPVVMLFFIMSTFGWIWSIGTVLHKKLPQGVKLNLAWLNVFLIVPILYMVIILYGFSFAVFSGANGEGFASAFAFYPALLITVHLLSMVMIFLALRFAAKVMKSVEIGRLAKFSDYAGEFFLIWFMPVGVWILQPRLNQMVKEQ
jgi:hypothetical protein